jgi:hypothetical protein
VDVWRISWTVWKAASGGEDCGVVESGIEILLCGGMLDVAKQVELSDADFWSDFGEVLGLVSCFTVSICFTGRGICRIRFLLDMSRGLDIVKSSI